MHRLVARLLVVVALTGCAMADRGEIDEPGPDPTENPEDVPENPAPDPAPGNLLANGDFAIAPWDSGTLQNYSLEHAPWGAASWGAAAAVFDDGDNHAMGFVRAATFDDIGYLFGQEDRGKFGFVRFVQGDMWGGGYFGPIQWQKFEPVPIADKRVVMSFDVYLGDHEPVGEGRHWILQGLNVWVSGPNMVAGPDKLGRKPLVMDLVVENECSESGCGLDHFEDASAYHYQVSVARPPHRQWAHVDVNITAHVLAAWNVFALPESARADLALYQAEYVVELSRMKASALVDNISLRVE
jgi:hypothetical protein